MEQKSFHINTLNRELFILIILVGVFLSAFIAGKFEIQEIYKIIIILILLPAILFLSINISKKPSLWRIDSTRLSLTFGRQIINYNTADIKKIGIGVRSGGRLITIHFHHHNKPARYWSNKLFQPQDDIDQLIEAFQNQPISVIMQ